MKDRHIVVLHPPLGEAVVEEVATPLSVRKHMDQLLERVAAGKPLMFGDGEGGISAYFIGEGWRIVIITAEELKARKLRGQIAQVGRVVAP